LITSFTNILKKDLMTKLRILFKKFLIEAGYETEYKSQLTKLELGIADIMNTTEEDEYEYIIHDSFLWSESNKGFHYWSNAAHEWALYMKANGFNVDQMLLYEYEQ